MGIAKSPIPVGIENMLNRSFLLPPEDDGTRHRALVTEIIEEFEGQLDSDLTRLVNKWHRPYPQMVPYVRLRIRVALARSMSLLIRGSRDREPARGFVQSGSALHVRQTWEER